MSAPFDGLEDRLLRGGIAPRHVRRYLRELAEHLADLTEAERQAGFNEADAASKARAALGPDAELADAMLKQRDFRSLSARFPWLVFGFVPLAALLLAAILQVLLFILLGNLTGGLGFGPHVTVVPQRLMPLAAVMQVFGNFLLIPGVALLFAAMALRQRLPLLWPLLSALLIAGLSLRWEIGPWTGAPQGWAAGLSYRVGGSAIRFGTTPVFLQSWWQTLPAHGLTLVIQYFLTLAPLAWLLRNRRKAAA